MYITEIGANSGIYRICNGTGETWGHCAIWAQGPAVGPPLLVFGVTKFGANPILWLDHLVPQATKELLGSVEEVGVYAVRLGEADHPRVLMFPWLVDGTDNWIGVEPDFAREIFADFVPSEVLDTWNWRPLDEVGAEEPLQILCDLGP